MCNVARVLYCLQWNGQHLDHRCNYCSGNHRSGNYRGGNHSCDNRSENHGCGDHGCDNRSGNHRSSGNYGQRGRVLW